MNEAVFLGECHDLLAKTENNCGFQSCIARMKNLRASLRRPWTGLRQEYLITRKVSG